MIRMQGGSLPRSLHDNEIIACSSWPAILLEDFLYFSQPSRSAFFVKKELGTSMTLMSKQCPVMLRRVQAIRCLLVGVGRWSLSKDQISFIFALIIPLNGKTVYRFAMDIMTNVKWFYFYRR
jgi:hypothetical protein